jgi:exopolysaccharide production protein ExoZ
MLRAVAALMVLLYHLVNITAFGWKDASGHLVQPARFINHIGFAGVDLFFVISGVVMVVTCFDRFGQPREAAAFLKRRIARIYPLYWVCTAAVIALVWLRPELASRDKFAWPAIVKSLLLWPQEQYPIVALGWTLTFEMFFYLVFAALLMFPRRLMLPALALWAAGTLALFPLFKDPAHRLTPDGHLSLPLFASPLALEFIAGCVIGWLIRKRDLPWGGFSLLVGIALLAVGGVYVGANHPLDAQYGLMRVGVFGTASALIVYGSIGMERRGLMTIPRWVSFMGDASYSTYLTHMYVLWLLAAAWPWAPTSGSTYAWVASLVGLVACSAVAGLCHIAVERPLIRLTARLLAPTAPPLPATAGAA